MKTKFLLTSLAIVFSSTFALADNNATISPNQDPIFICDNTPYLELNAVGDPNTHIFTWTIDDDLAGYGRTFYFVPQEDGEANKVIRLFKGVVKNDTVDFEASKFIDQVTINVNDCQK